MWLGKRWREHTLDIAETPDTGNTVTNGQDTASLLDVAANGGAGDAGLEDGRDLGRGCV
jgi:hypothetical protein